jgi:hypothetical protein
VGEEEKKQGYGLDKEVVKPAHLIARESGDLGEDYFFWWRNQKISLAVFMILFVIGIFWIWWLLIPAFLLLGYNLYANLNRIMALLKSYSERRKEEKDTGGS